MGKKIKFMGISHEHNLLAGDDFGGRLATPLSRTIAFNRANNWVAEVSDEDLSSEALAVLLTDENFLDVTDMPRVPLNRNQTTFLGLKDGDKVSVPAEVDLSDLQYAAPEDESDVAEEVPEKKKKS